MKLLGSTKSKITKYENAEKVANLEITEVILVHCNIVTNIYQQDSRVLYTLVPNKSVKNFIFVLTFDWEFLYTEVRLTHQNSKPLEIEDIIIIILVIS